jgi:hypothetical protein
MRRTPFETTAFTSCTFRLDARSKSSFPQPWKPGPSVPSKVFEEGLDYRDEPFLRHVVAAELVVEGEEAVEVAALGVKGGLGLARHVGREVECGKIRQTVFRGLNEG